MKVEDPPERSLGNVPWVMLLVLIEVVAHTLLGFVTDSAVLRVGLALLVGFLAFLPMRHRIWRGTAASRSPRADA